MIALKRTTSKNDDFIALVASLDADLARRDGDDHAFYHQFNSIQGLQYAVVAYSDSGPIGCGALKVHDSTTLEIKRMYVAPKARGKGIGATILEELENWAAELDYRHCVLETGKKQPEAIALYKKQRYLIIPNYGQYAGVENSICFKKEVSSNKNSAK